MISANDTTGINSRRELLNISTQNFGYYYNGEHRRASEGYAGTDATTTGTDTNAAGTNAEAR